MVSLRKWCLVGLAVVSVMTASISFAQRGGPPGGGFGGNVTELGLAGNEDVQKELDLLDDQIAKIKDVTDKSREGLREMFTGLRDLTEEQRTAKMEEIRALAETRSEDAKKQLASILLPHQMKRLSEIARQQRLRNSRGGSLSTDVIATELKLTDDQKEKLKAKAEELQAKLREKIAKARKDVEDELLSVLTPDQQTQWKELVGDTFEMQTPTWGRGGPSGRTRGNN